MNFAAIQTLFDNRRERGEDEADRKEAERREALRPDKEKLIAYTRSIMDLVGPPVKDKAAIAILDEAIPKIREVALWIKKQAEAL